MRQCFSVKFHNAKRSGGVQNTTHSFHGPCLYSQVDFRILWFEELQLTTVDEPNVQIYRTDGNSDNQVSHQHQSLESLDTIIHCNNLFRVRLIPKLDPIIVFSRRVLPMMHDMFCLQ